MKENKSIRGIIRKIYRAGFDGAYGKGSYPQRKYTDQVESALRQAFCEMLGEKEILELLLQFAKEKYVHDSNASFLLIQETEFMELAKAIVQQSRKVISGEE